MCSIFTDLLGFDHIKILKIDHHDDVVDIEITTTFNEITCRKCGKNIPFTGYSSPRKIRHLPILGKLCYVIIKPKIGQCPHCDDQPYTWQQVDWCRPKSRFTKAYEQDIMLALVNSTVSDVAIKEHLGEKSIRGILSHLVRGKTDWKRIKRLGLIGMDEISLKKGYQNFITLITSKEGRQVTLIGIIEGREKAPVKAFLKSIPGRLKRSITGVCCDMYDGYINAAYEALPKIFVIIDRFHVAQSYRKCLVNIRKSELARLRITLNTKQYESLKKAIGILRRNAELVSKDERNQLSKLFRYSPKLKEAYDLCRKITAIFNSRIGKRRANKKFNAWIALVEKSSVRGFDRFIKTFKKYQEPISNYFRKRETSGFVEGFNNKVKVTKRRCYGINSIKTLFQRLFLDTIGYDFFSKKQHLEKF